MMTIEASVEPVCIAAKGSRLKLDWTELTKPTVLLALVGMFISCVAAVGYFGYLVSYRIPDLEKRTEQISSELNSKMTSTTTDLHKKIDSMRSDFKEELKSMNTSMVGIKTNLMLLCGGGRKPFSKICSVKDLVNNARGITEIQGGFVEKGMITVTVFASRSDAPEPVVMSDDVGQQLPVIAWSPTGVTMFYPEKVANDSDISKALLWASAAASTRWYQEGDVLKVKFKNGEAAFEIAPDSRTHIDEIIQSLNATVDAMQATASR